MMIVKFSKVWVWFILSCILSSGTGEDFLHTIATTASVKSENILSSFSSLSSSIRPYALANLWQIKATRRKLAEEVDNGLSTPAQEVGEKDQRDEDANKTPPSGSAPEWAMDETETVQTSQTTDSPAATAVVTPAVTNETPTQIPSSSTPSTSTTTTTTTTGTNGSKKDDDDADDDDDNSETTTPKDQADKSADTTTTTTPSPSILPTVSPSAHPSASPTSSSMVDTPTEAPTKHHKKAKPTSSPASESQGTDVTITEPSLSPTTAPTTAPTMPPTTTATHTPTASPTAAPTHPVDPDPTALPTLAPAPVVTEREEVEGPPTPPPSRRSRKNKPSAMPVEFVDINNDNDASAASPTKPVADIPVDATPTLTPTHIPSLHPSIQETSIPTINPTKTVNTDTDRDRESDGENGEDIEDDSSGISATSVFIVFMGIMGMFAIYRFVYGSRNGDEVLNPSSSASQAYSPLPVHDEDRGDIEMNSKHASSSKGSAPVDWEEWDLDEDEDDITDKKHTLSLGFKSSSHGNGATGSAFSSGVAAVTSSSSQSKFTADPSASLPSRQVSSPPVPSSAASVAPMLSRGSSKSNSSNSLKDKDSMKMGVSPSVPTNVNISRGSTGHLNNKPLASTGSRDSSPAHIAVPESSSIPASPITPVPMLPKPPLVSPPPSEQPLISFDNVSQGSTSSSMMFGNVSNNNRNIPSTSVASAAAPTAMAKKSRNIQPKQDDDIFASIGLAAAPKAKPSQTVPDLDTIFAQHSSKKSAPVATKPSSTTSQKPSIGSKLSSRTQFEEEDIGVSSKWDEDKELDALMDEDD